MNAFDAHTAENNEEKLTQEENLSGNQPEQTTPSECDIQRQAEIEKLLCTDTLAFGYVYQGGQCTEYLFQGTPENIAYFIGSRPYVDEMIITDAVDMPILNTIGYFIDKCPDQELLDKIKQTLVPIQKGEAQAQPFFCPTLDEVEEYCAHRDPEDKDENGEMDTGVDIDPDLGF